MTSDELFMQRAMELALLGAGHVSPNPLVGCVVVHEGKIIGEGWHRKYGEAHAEVNALQAAGGSGRIRESTVYVNLEPCSHTGKTPPCADLLVHQQVKKVVIANIDSNPMVSGRGIERLKEAGIEVLTGVLEKEGRHLNRRFFTFIERKRPYIILKWAKTADGFIARENYESRWISNELSRQWVHKWRSEEDAVLVGTRTAAHDNPRLTVRDWTGRNPVRIVIDRFLRLPPSLHLLDRRERTLCYNVLKNEEHAELSLVRLDEGNFINQIMQDCYKRNIQSVLIEGGALTLNLFMEAGLWDEARVFTAERTFGQGIAAPGIKGRLLTRELMGTDLLEIFSHG